jgi:TRAP-type C4-dicarboxylate transport system permease small subunit
MFMLAPLIWRIVTVFPAAQIVMHIVAMAWIYVVLMMSITESSAIAGIMSFLLYGVLPVSIILYLMRTPQRKRKRAAAEKLARDSTPSAEKDEPSGNDIKSGN